MPPIVFLGIVILVLYLIQSFFAWKQIKSFNQEFLKMRRKGKVIVGKRSGRLVAGTIILFLVDSQGKILEAKIMQGISVFARFKDFNRFNEMNMIDLNPNHALVKKEMRFTRLAIENGRELYIRFLSGMMTADTYSVLTPFGLNISYAWTRLKDKFIHGRKEKQL